jgi:NifU-like protein involved in Fe-S cluster formation
VRTGHKTIDCPPAAGKPLRGSHAERGLQPPILELAGGSRVSAASKADASATAHSKLCGSTVTVDLKMDGDTVTDFAHEVKACALGQSLVSIMARNVVGAKADELRSLRETVRKMLKENGARPRTANGPTSPCSSRCATTRRATLRPC